jgi:uridylate kinase
MVINSIKILCECACGSRDSRNNQHFQLKICYNKGVGIPKERRSLMKRVLLKLSGEALAGEKKTGFDDQVCLGVARQVKKLVDIGVQVGLVTGGGNFWRGRSSEIIDRAKADHIGILATVMNGIYMSEIFRHLGMETEILTPFTCGGFTKLFSKDMAIDYLKQGKVVFFAGGTGHPYFTTDTGAVLRAIEIEAGTLLLAKAVDGIYDSDPRINPNAKRFDEISIKEVIARKLTAVDLTASILCMENDLPMLVFDLNDEDSIVNTVNGQFNGTKVTI